MRPKQKWPVSHAFGVGSASDLSQFSVLGSLLAFTHPSNGQNHVAAVDREPNPLIDNFARDEALERLAAKVYAPRPYVVPEGTCDKGMDEDRNPPDGRHDGEEAEAEQ